MTIVLFWAIPVRNCDSICCFFYCVFNYVALMTRLLSSIIATIWQPKSLLILNRIPSNLPPANNWNSSENFVFFFFGEKNPDCDKTILKISVDIWYGRNFVQLAYCINVWSLPFSIIFHKNNTNNKVVDRLNFKFFLIEIRHCTLCMGRIRNMKRLCSLANEIQLISLL